MGKLYDIAYGKGKYTNQNGEEKTSWQTVGAVFQNDKGGVYMLLDRAFNPAALAGGEKGNSCLLSLFPPKDKNQNNNNQRVEDDDVPF